ncbi:MAG: hypothetical protein QOF51_1189 [Chloroflexota bacterium]|nr:hypothetical protein [Chloroflexota bacterium]
MNSSRWNAAGESWPPLPWGEWRETGDTLHLWTQVVGKVKLQLCPALNELWQVALYPTSRGLATGRIPYETGAFGITFDFVEHELMVATSYGERRTMPLRPRSVAAFYHELMGILRALGIDVAISPLPSEVPEPIRLDEDERHTSYDPESARRWWQIVLQTSLVLDRYRSSFVGKSSPVLFWWGSFDVNTTRFSGRPAPPLPGAPRFMQLAEDQENICCGFWPGNATVGGVEIGEPCFYAYSYPEPAGFGAASLRAAAATYHPELGEFLLPYEAIRRTAAPAQTILDFFLSAYDAAATRAGWDPTLMAPR